MRQDMKIAKNQGSGKKCFWDCRFSMLLSWKGESLDHWDGTFRISLLLLILLSRKVNSKCS
jgi:hypothetical protein